MEVEIYEDDCGTLGEEVEDHVWAQISRLCRSWRVDEQWLQDLRESRKGAPVAILLLLLPNLIDLVMFLECLSKYVSDVMSLGTKDLSHLLLRLLPASIKQIYNPRFPRLSTLQLVTDSHIEFEFGPILQLKSLRIFGADSLSSPARELKTLYGVSSLHELKVINCEMNEDQILPML